PAESTGWARSVRPEHSGSSGRDQRLHHADRARRAKRAKLLTRLHGRGSRAALDDSKAVALEKRRGGLCQQDQLLDPRCARTLLELPHDALAETRSAAIGCHHDRSQQRDRAEALEGTGADQLRPFVCHHEFRTRRSQIARRQPVALEQQAHASHVPRIGPAQLQHRIAPPAMPRRLRHAAWWISTVTWESIGKWLSFSR